MTILDDDTQTIDMSDFEVAIPCEVDYHEFFESKGCAEWIIRMSVGELCHCRSEGAMLACTECVEIAKTRDDIAITCGCGCTDIMPMRRVIVSIEPINKKPE